MKEQYLIKHETKMARQLALQVIDKPDPPFWAHFLPMVFVFYTQKLKEYSLGLDNFVDNYLSSRRDAIKAAAAAKKARARMDLDQLLEKAGDMPPPARALYLQWMNQLTEHYLLLLNSNGNCHDELVRDGYMNKNNYLCVCDALSKAECEFNLGLLPGIEGDAEDVLLIVQRMNTGIATLHHQHANLIFP